MDYANLSLDKCHRIDVDAVDKLKKKIIHEFMKLLCLTEKGHKPNYQFILEEIGLVGLSSEKLLDPKDFIFAIQFYLNNKWQITTF